MTKRNFYLLCAIVGLIIPWWILISPYLAHQPVSAMFGLLFANAYTGSFSADLLLSLFVFWVFVFNETRRLSMNNAWAFMVSSAVLGLAFTFPLFLYFREQILPHAPSEN